MTTIALLKIKGVDGRKWRHRGKGESKQTGAPFAPDPRAMKKALKRQTRPPGSYRLRLATSSPRTCRSQSPYSQYTRRPSHRLCLGELVLLDPSECRGGSSSLSFKLRVEGMRISKKAQQRRDETSRHWQAAHIHVLLPAVPPLTAPQFRCGPGEKGVQNS